jgi:hypothetical protein
MLHVTYEATGELERGRLARIDADRGRTRVLLDRAAPLADVIRQLNIEIDDLMASCTWFQLWDSEIVSRNTPGAPLRIEYLLDGQEPHAAVVRERKGLVSVHIDPALTVTEFAAVMNPATEEFLAGGQWFQLHAGEIIDMSPGPMSHV